MERKQRHTLIFVGTTLGFLIVAGLTFTQELSVKIFLVWIASYFIFLLLYWLICWFAVPKKLRGRPERPREFEAVSIGSPTTDILPLIETSELTKSKIFSGIEHVLYRAERTHPNGTWICEFEIAADRIVARDIAYQSVESPVLDLSERVGDGRFLACLAGL